MLEEEDIDEDRKSESIGPQLREIQHSSEDVAETEKDPSHYEPHSDVQDNDRLQFLS